MVIAMYIKSLELPNRPLEGEVAMVTGAGRGIGKELARCLAFLGAHVVIAEISADTGIEVQELIRNEGGEAVFIESDVSSSKAVCDLVDAVIAQFGKIDILINNAIVVPFGSFLELNPHEWTRALSVNVLGAVNGIQAVLPSMLQRKHGTIVSMISSEGMPYASPYFASKCALGSLTQSAAIEIGEDAGVSIFNFGPGMVDTPGLEEAAQYMAPKLGMSVREFKHQSFNPGYDGLVPAEHAAAGLAIAILHGEDYHGEVADTFTSLSRYQKQTELEESLKYDLSDTEGLDRVFEGLLGVVQAYKDDFSKVNRLMRSFATKEFKKHVGCSVEMLIERISSTPHSISKEEWISASNRLQSYIENSIMILPKYVKDPDNLRIALNDLEERQEIVMEFMNTMNTLQVISV